MSMVVVVGAQWGDEGKGKIVDWLCARADVVIRFQGGHNAGHTLVIGEKTYHMSLLPSGVVRQNTLSIIANGVVLDPWAFLREVEKLRGQGLEIGPQNLRIAENTVLILPLHSALDRLREEYAGAARIGTTGRGIGPAYEDKIGRRAIRVIDLADGETLQNRLTRLFAHHDALFAGMGQTPVARESLYQQLLEIAPRILPYADPVWRTVDQLQRAGKRILFEGAQGALLDVDHGTYPYVTSSNTLAGAVATGAGVRLSRSAYVLGITKAYATRVGEGPFPSELKDETGQILAQRGREIGVVTGRNRRCGWFDAVLARQSVITNGIDGIALTKLDVLDGLAEIKICIGYYLGGERIDYFPAISRLQARVEPIYEILQGWHESSAKARSFFELPAAAIKYVVRIQELIGAPVALLSTSPQREDTILLRDSVCAMRGVVCGGWWWGFFINHKGKLRGFPKG